MKISKYYFVKGWIYPTALREKRVYKGEKNLNKYLTLLWNAGYNKPIVYIISKNQYEHFKKFGEI